VSLAARSAVLVALLACFAAGAAVVVVMDVAGPMAGLALPVAAAVAAVVGVRPIVGVQLAVLAVPLEFFSLRVGGETGLSPTEMLLLVSAGATLVHWSITVARPQVPMVLRAATATCVLIALGYAVAEDTLIVTKILVMWSAFVIAAVLVANSDEREITRLMYCVAIAGGIAGFVAVAGGSNQSLVEGGLIATNRAQASFAQPNVLGFFLVLAIPAAVVLAVRGRGMTRAFMALMAAGAVWGLMLSLSRTSLIGTFLGLGILLLWPDFRRWAAVGLAALALFALFNVQALEQSQQISVVTQRLATLGRTTTVESDPRLEMWKTTPKIIAANPLLGVGAGNYSVAAKRYALLDQNDMPFDHAHDVPLTIGAELGIPGLVVLAWFVVALGAMVLRAIEARGDPVRGALLLALAATMVGVAPISLADYPPRTNAIAATFILEVGALAALLRHARRAATPPAPSAPR
jgi:O-antigen ligase